MDKIAYQGIYTTFSSWHWCVWWVPSLFGEECITCGRCRWRRLSSSLHSINSYICALTRKLFDQKSATPPYPKATAKVSTALLNATGHSATSALIHPPNRIPMLGERHSKAAIGRCRIGTSDDGILSDHMQQREEKISVMACKRNEIFVRWLNSRPTIWPRYNSVYAVKLGKEMPIIAVPSAKGMKESRIETVKKQRRMMMTIVMMKFGQLDLRVSLKEFKCSEYRTYTLVCDHWRNIVWEHSQ